MPVITRITNPDNYEQAVLKYMAQTNCDRIEAQGNMVSLRCYLLLEHEDIDINWIAHFWIDLKTI